MKYFDISRFGKLLRLDLTRNKRTCLYYLLSMLAVFLFMQFTGYYIYFKSLSYSYTPVQIESAHENMYMFFLMTEFLLALVFMSSSFTFLKDKDRRISYFLLPATLLEKFLSRILIYTLGMFLLSLLAYGTADQIVVALFRVFHRDPVSVLPYAFHETWNFIPHTWNQIFDNGRFYSGGLVTVTSLVTYSTMWLSLYLLASLWFRKYAFILMSLLVIALLILSTILVFDNIANYFDILRDSSLMSFLFFGLTCLFTGLSYWLFKRKGAVN